ncbi:MAG: hypothetical protein MUD08_14645 [Cytophagales bacterium]|nr:hypothetical protein [Cytophagales bacterium]
MAGQLPLARGERLCCLLTDSNSETAENPVHPEILSEKKRRFEHFLPKTPFRNPADFGTG